MHLALLAKEADCTCAITTNGGVDSVACVAAGGGTPAIMAWRHASNGKEQRHFFTRLATQGHFERAATGGEFNRGEAVCANGGHFAGFSQQCKRPSTKGWCNVQEGDTTIRHANGHIHVDTALPSGDIRAGATTTVCLP